MAALFIAATTIVCVGFLWFYVVRPILEDFGIIRDGEPSSAVKPSQAVMPSAPPLATQTKQTDEADRPESVGLSVADKWLDRLEVDRTRTALIELMVYSGWKTGEIRSVVKGDTGTIGEEVAAARKRLGLAESERTLTVRDGQGEREIAMSS